MLELIVTSASSMSRGLAKHPGCCSTGCTPAAACPSLPFEMVGQTLELRVPCNPHPATLNVLQDANLGVWALDTERGEDMSPTPSDGGRQLGPPCRGHREPTVLQEVNGRFVGRAGVRVPIRDGPVFQIKRSTLSRPLPYAHDNIRRLYHPAGTPRRRWARRRGVAAASRRRR